MIKNVCRVLTTVQGHRATPDRPMRKPPKPQRNHRLRANAPSPQPSIYCRMACERDFWPFVVKAGTPWGIVRRALYAYLGMARAGRRGRGYQVLHAHLDGDDTRAEVDDFRPVEIGQRFVLRRLPGGRQRGRDDLLVEFKEEMTEDERLRTYMGALKREFKVPKHEEAPRSRVPYGIPRSKLRPAATDDERSRAYVDSDGSLVVLAVEESFII